MAKVRTFEVGDVVCLGENDSRIGKAIGVIFRVERVGWMSWKTDSGHPVQSFVGTVVDNGEYGWSSETISGYFYASDILMSEHNSSLFLDHTL